MDPMKQMIQQKLIANVIMDKCAQCKNLVFQDSLCSQERVIRFATPFWQNLLGEGAVMYEAENKPDSFVVNCVCKLDRKDPTVAKIRTVLDIADDDVLHSWDIEQNGASSMPPIMDLYKGAGGLLFLLTAEIRSTPRTWIYSPHRK